MSDALGIDLPLIISRWRTPASAYPRGCDDSGRVEVRTTRYESGYYHMHGVAAPDCGTRYDYYRAAKPLDVTELVIGGSTVMVDDALHWFSTREHAAAYSGHVLCAGLGLGLVVHALRANPRVTRITVVEREAGVIDLVGPYLGAAAGGPGGVKLTIVRGDWWGFDHEACGVPRPDGVFFDLLVGEGYTLAGAGMHAMLDMRRRWPGVPHRVFGMDSDALEELARKIEDAHYAATAVASRGGL